MHTKTNVHLVYGCQINITYIFCVVLFRCANAFLGAVIKKSNLMLAIECTVTEFQAFAAFTHPLLCVGVNIQTMFHSLSFILFSKKNHKHTLHRLGFNFKLFHLFAHMNSEYTHSHTESPFQACKFKFEYSNLMVALLNRNKFIFFFLFSLYNHIHIYDEMVLYGQTGNGKKKASFRVLEFSQCSLTLCMCLSLS